MHLAPWLANPHRSPGGTAPRDADSAAVRSFHRSLPGYRETPLVPLPRLAEELGVRAVLVKDESSRLGLPAFKMLGASWAVFRALAERCDPEPAPDLEALRTALAGSSPVRLITATDGNHGRAVARMGALLDLPVTVVVPRGVSETAVALIGGEGCEVQVLDLSYDDAVRHAADLAAADPSGLLVQDTSWPGYEDVPQWIVDGYATLFSEAAEQAEEMGLRFDAMFVPVGVGSLAHAAVQFAATRPAPCDVVAVEPDTAACVQASLAAGELTSVDTATTVMAGLNCGTPSYLAWPDLAAGLSGCVTVTDDQAAAAMDELAAAGVDSGACGAASLAALRTLASLGEDRGGLAMGRDSVVLLLNTEGRAKKSDDR
jgi:diaminopropionate ammonia-lyase